jgi:menaquinone-dependent protoporphyrinogen oxidase
MAGVLVVYATEHGSTRQVADVVATTLRRDGYAVEVRPVCDVGRSVDRYGLVVLGAPLYSGRWHPDAHEFLESHRAELERVPVAVFAMGPRTDNHESWRRSRGQLHRALARRGWLVPATVAVFGGVDPPCDGGGGSRRDLRDWGAIRAWAQSLRILVACGVAGRVPASPPGSTPGRRAAPAIGRR